MVFHYLATPYTRYPHGMEAAYREARKCAAMLTDTGVIVFAPVVYWHEISKEPVLSGMRYRDWIETQIPFMAMARSLIVAKMHGWNRSVGVRFEMRWFGARRKDIRLLPWEI